MKICALATAVGAFTLLSGSPAFAGSVDVNFIDVGQGRQAQINLNNSVHNVFAGQLYHNFTNGTDDCSSLSGIFATFCTELTQHVTHDPAAYNCSPLAGAPLSGPMGETRAQAVRDLYAHAGDAQYTNDGSQAGSDFAAAFQLAVWEVVYDYNGTSASLDRTGGSLKFTGHNDNNLSSGVLATLAELFASVGSNSAFNVYAVTNGCAQDQIVQAVPVPAPVLLGATGLIGVLWKRRRKNARA
jgi:hypothetical protein